jgi:hypothetical protein
VACPESNAAMVIVLGAARTAGPIERRSAIVSTSFMNV